MLIMQMNIMFPHKIVILIIEILQRVMIKENVRHEQKFMKNPDKKRSKEDANVSIIPKPSDLMNQGMKFLAI